MGEVINFSGEIKAKLGLKHDRTPVKTVQLHEVQTAAWNYDRVCIVGGPGSGKSTLADMVTASDIERSAPRPIWCSDVVWDVPWDEQPQVIAARINQNSAYVAEGIGVLRALRNGFIKDPELIIVRDTPIRPLGVVQARLWFQCVRWYAQMRQALTKPAYLRVVPGELRRA